MAAGCSVLQTPADLDGSHSYCSSRSALLKRRNTALIEEWSRLWGRRRACAVSVSNLPAKPECCVFLLEPTHLLLLVLFPPLGMPSPSVRQLSFQIQPSLSSSWSHKPTQALIFKIHGWNIALFIMKVKMMHFNCEIIEKERNIQRNKNKVLIIHHS